MAFRWRADDGPLKMVFGTPSPHQLKTEEKNVKVGPPPLTKLSGSAHEGCVLHTQPRVLRQLSAR